MPDRNRIPHGQTQSGKILQMSPKTKYILMGAVIGTVFGVWFLYFFAPVVGALIALLIWHCKQAKEKSGQTQILKETEKMDNSQSKEPPSVVKIVPAKQTDAAQGANGKGSEKTVQKPAEKRYFFDMIGDFFEKMTIGIFKFAFYKLPLSIYHLISRRVIGLLRAIFWCTVWVLVIGAAWGLAAFDAFLNFWRGVWAMIREFVLNIQDYIAPLWFCIAIIGSVYGLLYITLHWRAKKQNRPFNGVFSFLRRRKKLPPEDDVRKE